MNISRTLVAIGLDHDRLCAIAASLGQEGVKVKSWLTAAMPEGLDVRDAKAVGEWIGAELDRAELGKARVVFAVPRGEVVLKRLRLPKGAAVGEAEMAGIVRLQMARQLTMAVEGTAIDYVPLRDQGDDTAAAVMAAALPADRLRWYEGVAEAAGVKIDRLGLSSAGVAAYLGPVSQRHTGPIMGVAVGPRAVEFVVVEDGQLGFARAADLGSPAETEESFVQRIAVEAKRTWMSYRVGDGSAEVDALVVAGEGELAEQIARKCGEALEMSWAIAPPPSGDELPPDMPEAERLMAAPLLGLLTEQALGRPTLDFAHPRKAPDLAGARRRRMMLAALGLLIVGGAAYFVGADDLRRLRSREREALDRGASLRAKYSAYLKEHARLSHVQQWMRPHADWIAHVKWLVDQMPDPRQAVLDQVSGSLKAAVVMTPMKDGWYDKGGWRADQEAAIGLDGHTRQAEISRDLRERLLAQYKVETKGADTADQFAFVLTTNRPAPGTPPPAPPARAAKGGGQ